MKLVIFTLFTSETKYLSEILQIFCPVLIKELITTGFRVFAIILLIASYPESASILQNLSRFKTIYVLV